MDERSNITYLPACSDEEKKLWMKQAEENWNKLSDDTDGEYDDDDLAALTAPFPITGTVIVKHEPELSCDVHVDYKGYRRVRCSDKDLAEIYENLCDNHVGDGELLVNEYIILENSFGETVDVRKWNGEELIAVKPKKVSSLYWKQCKPFDEIQQCAFDSLQENEITVLYGKAGCGKTHLPLAHILSWLDKGTRDKLYVVYSYEPMRGAKTLGFEKGDHTDKVLLSGSIGNILASKLGSMEAVQRMIDDNLLEIIPTANIRGVEFGAKSIVLVTEAQNLDAYTLKTIVQRCQSGCKQIYEGDILEQTDAHLPNSGMQRLIEVFKGQAQFGCVKLHKGYRSPMCELADRM